MIARWSVRAVRRWKQEHKRFLKLVKIKERHAVIKVLQEKGEYAALRKLFEEILLAANLSMWRGMQRTIYVGNDRDLNVIHQLQLRGTLEHLTRGNYATVTNSQPEL